MLQCASECQEGKKQQQDNIMLLVFRLWLVIIISAVGIIFNFHQLQSIDFRDVGSQDRSLIISNTTHTIGMKQPRTYKKVARKHYYSGTSATQANELEKAALLRIKEYCGSAQQRHFPRLIASDNQSVTMTNVGLPFPQIKSEGAKVSLEWDEALSQINKIIDCLRVSKVRHLDVFQSLNMGGCKNIALSLPDQTISLYDFDLSVIDDKPVTAKIKMRMDAIGHNQFFTATNGTPFFTATDGTPFQDYEDVLRSNLISCLHAIGIISE